MMTMMTMETMTMELLPLPACMGIPVWALFTLGFAGVVFGVFYLIDNMRP